MSLPEHRRALQWAPLRCKNAPDGVEFFYDFSSSATGLRIFVTDLCSVWCASLTRDNIVKEAQEQNCSIDPSDSSTQLRTLLNKLKQSLEEGQNDLARSSAQTSIHLLMQTKLKLHAPLNMLAWTFDLQQQDSVYLAHTVTLPLLHEAAMMRQEMERLFQIIKDKDHVLSKLLDKIDNSATDLGLIFPGITGIKSRKQRIGVIEASKHILGMAAFDRTTWDADLRNGATGQSSRGTAFGSILAIVDTCSTAGSVSNDWIQRLPRLDEHSTAVAPSESEANDDDHNVGSSRRKQQNTVKSDDVGSSAESDFEDLENTARRQNRRRSKEQDPKVESSPPVRPIQAARSRPSPPFPPNASQSTQGREISDNNSDSESDSNVKRTAAARKKVIGKIGMLGGKRKAVLSPLPLLSRPVSSNAPISSWKLGVPIGQRAISQSPSKVSTPLRSRSRTPKIADNGADSDTASSSSSVLAGRFTQREPAIKIDTPQPTRKESAGVEESIEDRAQSKRQYLKRTQAQADTGPAKRKARRF